MTDQDSTNDGVSEGGRRRRGSQEKTSESRREENYENRGKGPRDKWDGRESR